MGSFSMPTLCTQTDQSDRKKKTLLAVFIAWLNPDLRLRPGGMDSYAKAWLQFGFKFPNLNYRTDLYPLLQV